MNAQKPARARGCAGMSGISRYGHVKAARQPASLGRFLQMRSRCAARSFLNGCLFLPVSRYII